MSKVLQPITACLRKADSTEENDDAEKRNKSSNSTSLTKDVSQPGLLWRMTSQVYNMGSGVVGVGVGSVKWAASTTYNVGSGVVSATQTVVSKVVPSAKPKPKKE